MAAGYEAACWLVLGKRRKNVKTLRFIWALINQTQGYKTRDISSGYVRVRVDW